MPLQSKVIPIQVRSNQAKTDWFHKKNPDLNAKQIKWDFDEDGDGEEDEMPVNLASMYPHINGLVLSNLDDRKLPQVPQLKTLVLEVTSSNPDNSMPNLSPVSNIEELEMENMEGFHVIKDLPNLKSIIAYGSAGSDSNANLIRSLSNNISSLPKLENVKADISLDFEENPDTSLPSEIKHLHQLKEFVATHISSISPNISFLKNANTINIQGSYASVPYSICNLPSKTKIILTKLSKKPTCLQCVSDENRSQVVCHTNNVPVSSNERIITLPSPTFHFNPSNNFVAPAVLLATNTNANIKGTCTDMKQLKNYYQSMITLIDTEITKNC